MSQPKRQWVLPIDGSELPDRALIGGKAWSLARMLSLGLPVPPAFVVTTEVCKAYLDGGSFPAELENQIADGIALLERATGQSFGKGARPLLVSVRSGAPVSMPGMMDTVLNLGITPATEAALAAACGDAAFARDVHRRFFDLYCHIVLKAGVEEFPKDGDPESWNALIRQASGSEVPASVEEQLLQAVRTVFESWNSRRAKRYREHHGIPHDLGTAVTVQAMVFGNMDRNSGTGVLFTRNPLSGEPTPYGEYLPQAQGEDVVSGKFTPRPLDTMLDSVPAAHRQLIQSAGVLERENGDVQDIEFTVQSGRLYLLQSRAAKRAPAAAVRFAVDMVAEGALDRETALARVSAEQVRLLLAPHLTAEPATAPLTTGDGACPGIGRGVVVTSSDEAERLARAGEAVVLARPTTSPEDLHGMLVAKAIITETGGSTSHAAVVSRALGLPCVVGCGSGSLAALAGRDVTVDGSGGRVFAGLLEVTAPDERADARLVLLADWARERTPLAIFRPHEAPADALDLSTLPGGEDPEQIGDLIRNCRGARGGAIASDGGVKAALAAKLEFIVGEPVLPLLLAAVHAASAGGGQS